MSALLAGPLENSEANTVRSCLKISRKNKLVSLPATLLFSAGLVYKVFSWVLTFHAFELCYLDKIIKNQAINMLDEIDPK